MLRRLGAAIALPYLEIMNGATLADKQQLKEAQARLDQNRSILDSAAINVKDFQQKLGSIDRQRLDQYLESIRDVENRLNDREAMLTEGRLKFDEQSVKLQPQGKNRMREHIERMMDMIVLTFQTDMTRVVTQSLGCEWGPNYEEYKDWAQKASLLSAALTMCITRARVRPIHSMPGFLNRAT